MGPAVSSLPKATGDPYLPVVVKKQDRYHLYTNHPFLLQSRQNTEERDIDYLKIGKLPGRWHDPYYFHKAHKVLGKIAASAKTDYDFGCVRTLAEYLDYPIDKAALEDYKSQLKTTELSKFDRKIFLESIIGKTYLEQNPNHVRIWNM